MTGSQGLEKNFKIAYRTIKSGHQPASRLADRDPPRGDRYRGDSRVLVDQRKEGESAESLRTSREECGRK